MNVIEKFKYARRAGVPLVAIGTQDPAATIRAITDSVNGSPVLVWDVQRGVVPVNDTGQEALSCIEVGNTTGNPLGLLDEVDKLPPRTVLFVHNANKVAEAAGLPWVQGVWNLRDVLKEDRRTLVLLGKDSTVPVELDGGDVVTFTEELPGYDELEVIVRSIDKSACDSLDDREEMDDKTVVAAVGAVRGLAAFPAEQAVAMAIREEGIDLDHLWEVKRSMIEETPGLSVWRGGEKFDDVKGLENAKMFAKQLMNGRKQYGGVVFIDEIEKLLAGSSTSGGDSSGVSQGVLQALLTYMQDNDVSGCMFLGHPGAGKSMLAKTLGAETNVPTIAMDTNAMKSSLVGATGQAVRTALKVVTAVTNGKPLFVATCNSIASLPPELRRRFTRGTFFFDLPDEMERAGIWNYYMAKYELPTQPMPNDKDWTGAEIRACCEGAWERNTTLLDAAKFIVPVAKADPERIERLRRKAAGRYISASYYGTYKLPAKAKEKRMVG